MKIFILVLISTIPIEALADRYECQNKSREHATLEASSLKEAQNKFKEIYGHRGAPQCWNLQPGVSPEIQNNSQLRPYVPQKNFVQIHESHSTCDADGRHTDAPASMTGFNCVDYRGNGLWRVIFGPGPRQGLRLARKIFKKERNEWILLAEFNQDNQLVFESPSGTKVRLASGGTSPQPASSQRGNQTDNSVPSSPSANPNPVDDVVKKGVGDILRRLGQ